MRKLLVTKYSKNAIPRLSIEIPVEITMAEFKTLVIEDFEMMPKILQDDEEKTHRMVQCLSSLITEGECIFQQMDLRVVINVC
jgi:hypothetical protein